MRETFKQIDRLELVVQKVNKSVTAMEAEVNAAESHLGSESVLKSIIRPFLVYKNYLLFEDSSLIKITDFFYFTNNISQKH
jgi:hypothetical protein